MEIIKRKNKEFRFRVLRPFYFDGRKVEIGEELEITEPEATGLVNIRKVAPILPDVFECIALRGFSVPGTKEKFTCFKGERILLKSNQALALMQQQLCLPIDDDVWRPLMRKLGQETRRNVWNPSREEPYSIKPASRAGDLVRSLGIDAMQFRSSYFERAMVDKGKRTVELSFSSEEPVERTWGIEILDHSKKSVSLDRLEKGGPLLLDHDKSSQVGVIEKSWVDVFLRKGFAQVRFSKNETGEETFQDVIDGIRSNVSVGYSVNEVVLEKESKPQNIYRVTSWQPYEISLVSIPADINVGVGRSG